MFLMGYHFTIRYKRTHQHANADALSRLPVGPDASFHDDSALQVHSVRERLLEDSLVDASQIARETEADATLKLVKHFVLTRWPPSVSSLSHPELSPYFHDRHVISEINGCLVKDTQVIVPPPLQQTVLRLLHQSHLGRVKMKQLARGLAGGPASIVRSTRSHAPVRPAPKFTRCRNKHFSPGTNPKRFGPACTWTLRVLCGARNVC